VLRRAATLTCVVSGFSRTVAVHARNIHNVNRITCIICIVNDAGFDLNLLVVFDALLIERSVTRAAQRVGLSQPAFSNALARLRSAIGDPLFERRDSAMSATPRALAMAAPVQAALAEMRHVLRFPAHPETSSPTITIEANEYARCLILPAATALLQKRAPLVRLNVCGRSGSSMRTADLILDWAGVERRGASAVILRDVLVGVAARAVRRRSADAVVGSANGHRIADSLSALCLASQTDAVAYVPLRLARRFSVGLHLKLFKLQTPQRLRLELAWQAESESAEAAAMVKNCIVDAARRLAGGRGL
jgi:DNA-binding transcriptional LysR family regulator